MTKVYVKPYLRIIVRKGVKVRIKVKGYYKSPPKVYIIRKSAIKDTSPKLLKDNKKLLKRLANL